MARWVLLLLLAFVGGGALAQDAAPPRFALPLDCRLGENCVVQNYVDADPGPGSKDPACGPLTYDGHDGLDFRVPGAAARVGVAVLAPAAGTVRGARDGEIDGLFRTGGRAAVQDRECGNGVVIDHGGGWTSQLCHMRQGSVRVRSGDQVTAGQPIGLIGMSGWTEFPHVHLTIRRNNEKIDPLTGGPLGAPCSATPAGPGALWTPAARAQLTYRGTTLFALGFTGSAPGQGVRADDLQADVTRAGPALVFWAQSSGPLNGDILRVRLYAPNGELLAEGTRRQPRDQADAFVFAGRRTPQGGWPAGTYRGEARIERAGRAIAQRNTSLTLR